MIKQQESAAAMEALTQEMGVAARALAAWRRRTVHLFHHNDADGLSSGAILSRAFQRAGYDVRRVCLEKPYPTVLEKIFDRQGEIVVFADFAGRIAPMISDLNRGRNLTLILDHHVARQSTDPAVYNLDPELFGFKGDRDITASTTCFLFARTLDPANKDLAHLAVVGAVGDGFFVDHRLAGPNRAVALQAERQGKIEIRTSGNREMYIYHSPRGPIPVDDLSAYLDTLGAAGYYQEGPEMGIRVCLEGFSDESDRMMQTFREVQEAAFAAEARRLGRDELQMTPHLQWFHVKDRFMPMGVKMIGKFCEAIKDKNFTDPERYLAGFQIIPDRIPGFGDMALNQVKISMRVSPYLEEEIRCGSAPGLDELLPPATRRLGGFSDACHRLAAATTVPSGKEAALIREMEKMLTHALK